MKNLYCFYIACFAVILHIDPLLAIDLQPGEVRAPKPGINFLQLSYQISERGNRYQQGEKLPGSPEIDVAQFIMRLGHSFQVAEYPALAYVQVPVGYNHPGGSLSTQTGDSGFGDTTVMLAIWPYANRETQTYFGLGSYLTLPSGSYSAERSFNMGQNRYSSAFQIGFQRPIIGSLTGMVALDATLYADNDEFGVKRATLKQDVLYTGQAGLRYDFSAQYSMAATYLYTSGGETSVYGVNRDDTIGLNRYQLSAIANFSFGRLTLQYGGDLKTENSFIENNRWIFRYTWLF